MNWFTAVVFVTLLVFCQMAKIPNPGSKKALQQGCVCPVVGNNYGKGIPWPRTDGLDPNEHPSFWMRDDCPLHGRKDTINDTIDE